MRRRHLTVTALLALATACSGEREAERAGGGGSGTAVVCMVSEPATLNAFVSPAQASADLTPVLFSTLVRIDDAGEAAPGLATDWEWGEEGRTLHFGIRPGVTWHDGRPVTAEDVAFTLRIAADSAYAYWSQADFESLEDVTVLDSATVRLRFAAPYAAGLEPFAFLPIQPHHLLADVEGEAFARAEYHRAPVGSGPYRIRGRTAGGDIILERRVEGAGPERLVLRFIPEMATRLVELQTGAVHACVMGGAAADEVQDAQQLRALPLGPAGVQFVALDTRRPPLDDSRVRRAMSAALDRQTLAQVTSPVARPAGSFVPWSSPFRVDSLRQPDADLELATALLDSAGYSLGDDGIRVGPGGTPLRVTIASDQTGQELLTLIQGQVRRAGIDARIELMEAATFYDQIQDPERRPMAMAVTLNPEKIRAYDPYAELHSEGFLNLSSYRSAAVDSLTEALRQTTEEADRARMFAQLQRLVSRDVPALYIAYAPRILAVGPGLEGVDVSSTGPFANLEGWRVTR